MSASSSPAPAPCTTPRWTEFTHGLCEQLNCNRCLILVGGNDIVGQVMPVVDVACRHPSVAEAYGGGTPSPAVCCTPLEMPRVTFTTLENQQTVQGCMAVYGRVPFFAVLDMRDDDDSHSFIYDLKDEDSTALNVVALTRHLVEFLVRVAAGTEPRSRQGAAPPPADMFAPSHGAVLCEARAAVTSTFARLIGKAPTATAAAALPSSSSSPATASPSPSVASGCPSGALCVFWSDRCPCCPGVLMLVEALVKLLRLVAARHAGHPPGGLSLTFPFVVANIDDNDFSKDEWPVAQREQVVPCIVAYPAPGFAPVVFKGERTLERLIRFMCEHCLPTSDVAECTPHILEEALRVAAALSVEQLMTVIEEGTAHYATATAAYEAFESTEDAEALRAAVAEVRAAALPFTLETEVRRTAAQGGAAAAGSARTNSMEGDVDGGVVAEGERGDGAADTKAGGAASLAVEVLPVAPSTSYKRPRE